MPEVNVDLQVAVDTDELQIPNESTIASWATAALTIAGYQAKNAVLSVRVVDENEIRELNNKYRNIDKTTNVLSFPYEALPGVELDFLGDIIACASVIASESRDQSKAIEHHWAHMIVHSTLHLLGYDHIDSAQADQMEALEIEILSTLDIPNPYGELDTP